MATSLTLTALEAMLADDYPATDRITVSAAD
jgi:hypothetical protein